MFVLSILGLGSSARAQSDPDNPVDAIPTATPIKHVIIIVGENRSFDHLFAAYVPKKKGCYPKSVISVRPAAAVGRSSDRWPR
jgi:phospholipase C